MFFWTLAIIFIFLQAVGLPVDGVTWLALWAVMTRPAKQGWVVVVVLGWLLNLVEGSPWGWLSLVYLGIGMGLWLYRKKYHPHNPVFVWLFFAGGMLAAPLSGVEGLTNSTGVWGEAFTWIQAAVGGLVAVALRSRMVEGRGGGLSLEYK